MSFYPMAYNTWRRVLASCHATISLLLVFVVLTAGACKKDPDWLVKLSQIIDSINKDLETIAPSLAEDATPQQVFVGLTRLDKMMDRVIIDLRTFFQNYPEAWKNTKLIEKRLSKELFRLRKNMRQIVTAGSAWHEKLKHRKEFTDLTSRIVKKIQESDKVTRKYQPEE